MIGGTRANFAHEVLLGLCGLARPNVLPHRCRDRGWRAPSVQVANCASVHRVGQILVAEVRGCFAALALALPGCDVVLRSRRLNFRLTAETTRTRVAP